MRITFLLIVLSLLITECFAKKTIVKHITSDVICVTPDKKQLHTLGWPNDIINSIAVRTKDGIVLIDTQNSPANANLIKSSIIKSFGDSTFAYIINTHGHSCHSGGNCVFDNNNIVAHTNSSTEIKNYDDIFLGQTVEYLRKEIYFKSNALDTVTVVGALSDSINEAIDLYKFYEDDLINNYKARYPNITFDDTLSLHLSDKEIYLFYMGKGHGVADIAVYIKEDKVLCTGNLFHLGSYEEEAMPSFYLNRENDINHWIQTLTTILSNENKIEYVISTHGKKSFNRKNIEFINEYCKAVKTKVETAKRNNEAIETVQDIELFKDVFKKYSGVLNINNNVKEMHARNINIIWKYL